MRAQRLSEIAGAVGGRLVGDDATVTSVAVHASRVGPGTLFVALPGTRTDGHGFVIEAFDRGARGVLVERSDGLPGPAVTVASTPDALLALAARARSTLGARVIGITGSVGKTSTKDMAFSVLAERFGTHASPASFNNQVGVPLTILGTDPGVDVLVCEIGAGVVGEIADLCRVVRPHIGVVTSVGVAHLETFGTRANIGRAKAELVEALPPHGLAILHADDPVVRTFARRTAAAVWTFGRSPGADIRAEGVSLDEMARARFVLVARGDRADVRLAVPGEHMVANALAAAGCGLALGLSPAECARGLGRARVSRWRMEVRRAGGLVVLNDAYNAGPASVQAALRTARRMAGGGRCIAVLGAMAELGPISGLAHREVGAAAATLGVDVLIAVGPAASPIGEAALAAGLAPGRVVAVGDVEEGLDAVRRTAMAGDVVLVKGSRVAGLERLAARLAQPSAAIHHSVNSEQRPSASSSITHRFT